ncbi:MAG: hypothetical protein M1838_003297 [Thelocarpon superellum]|nr:MAG: hypothetical protein M1838_003297 [Thelocarpon superellum]
MNAKIVLVKLSPLPRIAPQAVAGAVPAANAATGAVNAVQQTTTTAAGAQAVDIPPASVPPQVPASDPTGNDPISQASDGSLILDKTSNAGGFALRYKISGPAAQFSTSSQVPGATQAESAAGTFGLNVLLHGDGADSFDTFPNQAVQSNLMGVVIRTPDPGLHWGGGTGNLTRPDGVSHSAAVDDLIQNQILPTQVAFNKSQVYFTGVSGGSLTLAGFFVPAFMNKYRTGVLLNCGALPPQTQYGVEFVDPDDVMKTTVIHYQSTKQELDDLRPAIPAAITEYERLARNAGLSDAQINAMQTVNNEPNGGHCAFDGQTFDGGVQLMANSYANVILPGGNGQVAGIGNVKTGVVGNENLAFTPGT